MKPRISVYSLPLVVNICDQMLREVLKNDQFSVAHVVMNPGSSSLLHSHRKMQEVNVFTRGFGLLGYNGRHEEVRAGAVNWVPANIKHRISNIGATSLEYLVIALPPFDPTDVFVAEDQGRAPLSGVPFKFLEVIESFDGAKIMPYCYHPVLDLSCAFGWVTNDPARRKKPHYHKVLTEYIYIVEGKGYVEVDGNAQAVTAGDWLEIQPTEPHAIRNPNDQHLVALCICSPHFDKTDVYYA
jgi:mannose-6-phosphate isomerase-like protein (cupin superfamily)